jgi:hypothetical protein
MLGELKFVELLPFIPVLSVLTPDEPVLVEVPFEELVLDALELEELMSEELVPAAPELFIPEPLILEPFMLELLILEPPEPRNPASRPPNLPNELASIQ